MLMKPIFCVRYAYHARHSLRCAVKLLFCYLAVFTYDATRCTSRSMLSSAALSQHVYIAPLLLN